jgi:hypothetical protein
MNLSRSVTASQAKQAFGELLAIAANEPVAVERHGKVVAVVGPPGLLERAAALDERRLARDAQRGVEMRRLIAHQQIALELLTGTARSREALIAAAQAEVDRWQRERLCSRDYIARWREWLRKPVPKLAKLMASDADGWGTAMRQNSPFALIAPQQPV